MHIGFNLVFLVPGETGGTETYARGLLPALQAVAPAGTRLTAFLTRDAAGTPGPWNELDEVVMLPASGRRRPAWVWAEQMLVPRAGEDNGVDLMHSLANTGPVLGRFKRVVTVHDLHYRTAPDAHFGARGLGMRALVPLAVRASDRILAVSVDTRNQLTDLLGLTGSRVDVIPHGVAIPQTPSPDEVTAVRARYALGNRSLILSPSAKRPHKNLARLLAALALLRPCDRPLLVLPGYSTPHETELRATAAALGIADDVRFLGWLPDRELDALHAAASLVAFPSLAEGFGLPVLEAMARGVPVVCSDRGPMVEVSGEAAVLVDPTDPEAISSGIRRVITNPALAEHLSGAGRERAARFTWERAARATLESYGEALRTGGRIRGRRKVDRG
jgi:glycosyltransferase involved in cell wall biosynthesis